MPGLFRHPPQPWQRRPSVVPFLGGCPVGSYDCDYFDRIEVDGWGPDWVPTGTASQYAADGSVATQTQTAASVSLHAVRSAVNELNIRQTVKIATDKLAVGGSQNAYIGGRFLDHQNYYRAQLQFTTGQLLRLNLVKLVANVTTTLVADTTVPGTHVAGDFWWFQFDCVGTSPTTLRARAWKVGNSQSDWQVATTDSEATLQVTGAGSLRSFLGSGTSNTPVEFAFDEWVAEPAAGGLVIATLADTSAYSDSVGRVGVFGRQLADSALISDAPLRVLAASRTLTEGVPASALVARQTAATRQVTDSVPASAAIARVVSLLRTAADSNVVTEAVGAFRLGANLTRTLADTVVATDTVVRAIARARFLADTVAMSDAITRVASLIRTAAQNNAVTESVAAARSFLRSTADTVITSELPIRVLGLTRLAAETVVTSATAARVASLTRSVAQSNATTDAVAAVKGAANLVRIIADTVPTSAIAVRVVSLSRSVADSVPVSDAVARLILGMLRAGVGPILRVAHIRPKIDTTPGEPE